MSRYIKADALRHRVLYFADARNLNGNHEQAKAYNHCLCMIDDEPTADVVEVIPCGDCIYAKPYNKKWQLPINENLLWCEHHNEEKEPNWFCADAIERTVEDEQIH